jgi:hypothetical protein
MDWMPEEDTVQALIQLHGIPEEFLAAELFDFVKFWVQRGDSRPGWDATFLARMKHQWQWRQQHETKQRITDAGGRPISEYDKLWNDTFEEAWGDTGGYEIDTVIVRSNPDTTAD